MADTPRYAVVVMHGIGEQQRYSTLDGHVVDINSDGADPCPTAVLVGHRGVSDRSRRIVHGATSVSVRLGDAVRQQGEVAIAMLAAPEGTDDREQLRVANVRVLGELLVLPAPEEILDAWVLTGDASQILNPDLEAAGEDLLLATCC